MSNMTPTTVVSIESACGRFELSDLFREDYSLYQTPSLQLRSPVSEGNRELEFWDNDKYLLDLFQALEEDFHTVEYFELMATCDKYGWDLAEVCSILRAMFLAAMEVNMFET